MKIDKNELILAKAFLDENIDRLIDWSIGDIRRCCRMKKDGTCKDKGALVGAFILWCCAIDYFGGLYSNNSSGKTIDRYKAIVTKYLKKYDYKKLYDLRWSLLHYYSPHHYVLYHENNIENNKNIHLTKRKEGIMLHLGTSIKDLELAISQYKNDLKKHDELKIKAWRYYRKQYPIMPIKVENVIKPQTFSSLATGSAISLQSISASGTTNELLWTKLLKLDESKR